MAEICQEIIDSYGKGSLARFLNRECTEQDIQKFKDEPSKLAASIGIRITNCRLGIPKSLDARREFAYASSFLNCRTRFSNRENITVFYANSPKGEIIGYAIVKSYDGVGSVLEKFDVHKKFRRGRRGSEHAIDKEVVLNDQIFHIGLGHAITEKVSEIISGPIGVHAANENSQYICQSLGYKPYYEDHSEFLYLRDKVPAALLLL